MGETDQKLWRTLFAHVVAAWQDLSWEHVTWVGADEMNRRKGHNYLTVFVDLKAKRVLLAVEGKDASVWERFAEELGLHNGHPKAITRVAVDMSPAYQKGVRENFGNAQAVFDKFHVVILAHWQQGLTTAFLEGLNSLFSAVKRKARGYRSTEHQTAMLYFVAGKLEIPYYA